MQQEKGSWRKCAAWATKKDLEWLVLLNSGNIQAQEMELLKCKNDPWHWIVHWVETEDAQNKEQPFQPFPNLKHLQVLTWYWSNERFLLVPKSRQMSVTWLFCALYLWDAMFHPSRLTFFQNKKEDDAEANLKRVVTMHSRLPTWMQEWQPIKQTFCQLSFPRSRSEIKGVPAGAHHVRGFTATGVFEDEAAFTEEVDEVLAAIKPALGKHGKCTMVSSASPSYFKQLVFDEV